MTVKRLRTYYWLTKPGIIYGNALTAAAGFFLASRGMVDLELLVATLLGLSLVIASACVSNNVLDRRLDAAMARTRRRALVRGTVSVRSALIYAAVLGAAGFALLIAATNWTAVAVTAVGYVDYIALYGWSKRHSVHGTVVGSISGAVPPVVGYTAVTGRLDLGALLLFAILVFWQMPHFYSIALFRRGDYSAAGLPVLPVVSSARTVKIQIVCYIFAFALATAALSVFGYAGYTYRVIALALSIIWLALAVKGFRAPNDERWARQMFFVSLIVITVLSIAISLGPVLP